VRAVPLPIVRCDRGAAGACRRRRLDNLSRTFFRIWPDAHGSTLSATVAFCFPEADESLVAEVTPLRARSRIALQGWVPCSPARPNHLILTIRIRWILRFAMACWGVDLPAQVIGSATKGRASGRVLGRRAGCSSPGRKSHMPLPDR